MSLMGFFPLVAYSSGLRVGFETGNVKGTYKKSATSISPLSGNNQVVHLQYRSPYTIVFGLEAGRAALSGSKISDGTTTKYNFSHQFMGLNIGLELENKFLSLVIAPQFIYPIFSTGTYYSEKSGTTNYVSKKLSAKTGLAGIEVPVYIDFNHFYIGFKILNYETNEMTVEYATGETEKIGYKEGYTLMIGWKTGKKSSRRRR